ncbi:MAG: Na+/H+ antiporter NhaA [Myxococcales bacterium]|nr:Na+/H+ antiporter NhaA [Myxococcales bacterium]MCB9533977.1 Na+/H+ antiporter NhaA [Myxococcales bacterium]
MTETSRLREAAPGLVLLAAATVGMVVANTPAAASVTAALATKVGPVIGPLSLNKSVIHWINDGLMAIFFLVVGLELKRELVGGRLANARVALLPALAAVGGMAVPALIYAAFHASSPATLVGWAIPAATDIAFALCVVTLAGPRVPVALRVFLVTVAVVDDLGAILVIALFYSGKLAVVPLVVAGAAVGALAALSRSHVRALAPYLIVGAVLWVAVLKSGIHATLAGVITALFVPHAQRVTTADVGVTIDAASTDSPLLRLEHALHPWVSYAVLPIFGFANAGVPLVGMGLADALAQTPLSIATALVVGKPVGICLAVWLAVRLGVAALPEGTNWRGLIGAGCAAGIGFTMSLFIGGLAFESVEQLAGVRIGVLAGSLISAALALAIFQTLPVANGRESGEGDGVSSAAQAAAAA